MKSQTFRQFTKMMSPNLQTLHKRWCRQYSDTSQRWCRQYLDISQRRCGQCSNTSHRWCRQRAQIFHNDESHTCSASISKIQFALATLVAFVLIHASLLIRVGCQAMNTSVVLLSDDVAKSPKGIQFTTMMSPYMTHHNKFWSIQQLFSTRWRNA